MKWGFCARIKQKDAKSWAKCDRRPERIGTLGVKLDLITIVKN